MTAPLPSNFKHSQEIKNFYIFLKNELSYYGDDDKFSLIENGFKRIRQIEPTFTFTDLARLLEMHGNPALKYTKEFTDLETKVKDSVSEIFPSKETK